MKTYLQLRNVSVGLFSLILLAVVSCSRSSSRTEYYYPADLKSMNLPVWQVTNAIPVTPDQAVAAATRYLSPKHPDIASWDVENIDLSNSVGAWVYQISLIDRHSGRYDFESVRVLMDGNVWKPSPERKQ
jgi:hypothetical protein